MKLRCFLLILGLVSSHLFGMEEFAKESIVISHQEFLLFFKNKFRYDLFDNFYEYNYLIKKEVGQKFDRLSYYIQKNNPLNLVIGNLRDFFIQIGLKQNIDNTDIRDQYSLMLSKFHREDIFSIKTTNAPLDIIKALKVVFMSYFEEKNLDKRSKLKDEYYADLPHIYIIISPISAQEVIIIGAPAVRQDQMYPWEIDYSAFFNEQTAPRWPVYMLGFSMFFPIIIFKIPSLVNYWGEQMNNNFLVEDHTSALGISSSASPSEIKNTCRELFLQWHPDKNPSADASDKFQRIQTSCNFLRK